MGEALTFVLVVFIGFVIFCIYFIFKQFQFILVSVNLYKKMVKQQIAITEILLDIRDHTKNFDKKDKKAIEMSDELENELDNELDNEFDTSKKKYGFCPICNVPLVQIDGDLVCPLHGKEFQIKK